MNLLIFKLHLCDLLWIRRTTSLQQIHNILTCQDVVDLLWIRWRLQQKWVMISISDRLTAATINKETYRWRQIRKHGRCTDADKILQECKRLSPPPSGDVNVIH